MRAMARTETGDERSLIELKAVDAAYPLYGAVALDPPQALAAALAQRDGRWGAVVDAASADAARAACSAIRSASAMPTFILRAVLTHEPDAATGGFEFGPRVMIATPALAETGLLQPGALVTYGYRLRLAPGRRRRRLDRRDQGGVPRCRLAHPRLRRRRAERCERLLDRVSVFLTLVGLTALLVGGVGIGNAVRGYLGGKTATIATLKCLGASGRLVFAAYLAADHDAWRRAASPSACCSARWRRSSRCRCSPSLSGRPRGSASIPRRCCSRRRSAC